MPPLREFSVTRLKEVMTAIIIVMIGEMTTIGQIRMIIEDFVVLLPNETGVKAVMNMLAPSGLEANRQNTRSVTTASRRKESSNPFRAPGEAEKQASEQANAGS